MTLPPFEPNGMPLSTGIRLQTAVGNNIDEMFLRNPGNAPLSQLFGRHQGVHFGRRGIAYNLNQRRTAVALRLETGLSHHRFHRCATR